MFANYFAVVLLSRFDFFACIGDRYVWAGKLVRGAYMVSERERAKEEGYESPVFDVSSNSLGFEEIDYFAVEWPRS